MATKNDLLTTWCAWTGEPIPEARHRIRVLSEAGLLPARSHPLTVADMARGIIGFVVPDTHKDAADTVKHLCEFHCPAYEANGDKCIGTVNLLEAMKTVLQPPYNLLSFSFSSTGYVELFVERLFPNCEGYTHAKYYFKSPIQKLVIDPYTPVTNTKSINLDTVQHLLTLMKENDNNGTAEQDLNCSRREEDRSLDGKARAFASARV